MNEKIKFRFGTDGVRGIIDKGFNERLVTVLTKSTTRHWSRGYGLRHLLVGYDARTKSRTYATIAANVALNHGIDTVMMGKSMLLLDWVFALVLIWWFKSRLVVIRSFTMVLQDLGTQPREKTQN
ncbi:MAG: hypothetical protein L7H10_04705 [Vulcanisaeta sp.]|nr:hypothetical protein [Vulcanisaeta sp.]